MRYSSKRPSSSAELMRAAHCISRRRRMSSMSFSGKLWTRLRPASFPAAQAGAAAGLVVRGERRRGGGNDGGHVFVVGDDRHHADGRAKTGHPFFPPEAEI